MARPAYDTLAPDYCRLWRALAVRAERRADALAMARRILAGAERYRAVERICEVPWYVVGIIHALEADLSWTCHLHNGDPLVARTVHVPAGRPLAGSPPYSWEESAIDAMDYDRLSEVTDWSIPRIAYELEGYNGWGYRRYHPDVLSPYLWAGSAHYAGGKYASDGRWDGSLVSGQIGAMVLLRALMDLDGSVRPALEAGQGAEPATGPATGPASEAPATRLASPPPANPLDQATPGFELRGVQQRLADLGYYTGLIDGRTGPKTVGALSAFQAACGLAVDGLYGPLTRAALAAPDAPAAPPSPERLATTATDLRQMGSVTIQAADKVALGAKLLAGLGAAGLTQQTGMLAGAQSLLDEMRALRPLIDGATEILSWAAGNWPTLALIGGGAGVWYARQIILRRVAQYRADRPV